MEEGILSRKLAFDCGHGDALEETECLDNTQLISEKPLKVT